MEKSLAIPVKLILVQRAHGERQAPGPVPDAGGVQRGPNDQQAAKRQSSRWCRPLAAEQGRERTEVLLPLRKAI